MSSVATPRHVYGQDPGFRTRGVRHAHLDDCYQVIFQRANLFNTILWVLQNLSHQFLADVGWKKWQTLESDLKVTLPSSTWQLSWPSTWPCPSSSLTREASNRPWSLRWRWRCHWRARLGVWLSGSMKPETLPLIFFIIYKHYYPWNLKNNFYYVFFFVIIIQDQKHNYYQIVIIIITIQETLNILIIFSFS